jgi:hypothetical protein
MEIFFYCLGFKIVPNLTLNFQFVLLGAVPFPIDVPRLKDLGVRGVITLNESYETLVPTTLYHVSIQHIPGFGGFNCFEG